METLHNLPAYQITLDLNLRDLKSLCLTNKKFSRMKIFGG